ncbi:MAG: 6-hydroxymethylpterin diphosphokinase MptE-like protein [Peptococcales bacterium]
MSFKKSNKLYQFCRKLVFVYWFNIKFQINRFCRTRFNLKSKYDLLKDLKDIHCGERCFIIATGPSLTLDDLNKLRYEKTFGMNSLCKVFDNLGWETTYYGIQDKNVYIRIKDYIEKINKSKILFGSTISPDIKLNNEFFTYPLHLLNHRYSISKYTIDFSNDAFSIVYDGYSITYSLIQLAVYMGFKEIYLIGADCNYLDDKSKQHFIESGHYDANYKTASERMIFSYKEAKKYADNNNIKIFNATRGGMLEVFPRVDLDEVLGLK